MSADPWQSTNFGVFCRGIGPNNEPVFWDPIRENKPHALDVGETGAGKTASRTSTLIQSYFWDESPMGFHHYVIDGKGGGDYRFFEEEPWSDHATLVTDPRDIHDAIEGIVNRIEDRARIMASNPIRAWRTPSRLRPADDENYRPGVDGYDGAEVMMKPETWHMLTPEFRESMSDELLDLDLLIVSADEIAEFTDEEKGRGGADATATRTKRRLRRGVSLGRFAGVHWLLGLQRPDVSFLGPSTRDQVGARIAFGRMDSAAFNMFTGQGFSRPDDEDQMMRWALEQSGDPGYGLAMGFDPKDPSRMFRIRHFYTDPTWLYPEVGPDGEVGSVTTPTVAVADIARTVLSSPMKPEGLWGRKEGGERKKSEVVRGLEGEGPRGGWLQRNVRGMFLMMGAWGNALRVPTPGRVRWEGFRDEAGQTHGWRCAACGSRGYLEADHVRPVSLGGSDGMDNAQMLCGPSTRRGTCHWWKTKGDRAARGMALGVWGWLVKARARRA